MTLLVTDGVNVLLAEGYITTVWRRSSLLFYASAGNLQGLKCVSAFPRLKPA